MDDACRLSHPELRPLRSEAAREDAAPDAPDGAAVSHTTWRFAYVGCEGPDSGQVPPCSRYRSHRQLDADSGRSRDRDQTAQFNDLRMSLKTIDF